MMKNGLIIDEGTPQFLIDKHGRKNLEEVFLKLSRSENEFNYNLWSFLKTFLFNN